MNLLEFLYLIGCGVSFFMALNELSYKKKGEDYSNVEFATLMILALLFSLTSWGFTIYEIYFDKDVKKKKKEEEDENNTAGV